MSSTTGTGSPTLPKDFTFKTVPVQGGKQYVEVKERVRYLHEQWFGRYDIRTAFTYIEAQKLFIVHAELTLHHPTPEGLTVSRLYQGMSQAVVTVKGITAQAALEVAETSAVGRALAMAGIGSDDAIASWDEIMKAELRKSQAVENATDELAAEERERQQEEKDREAFLEAMSRVTSGAMLTDLLRQAQQEPRPALAQLMVSTIRLYASQNDYVPEKGVGYVKRGTSGAEVSKQKGADATQAALSQLKAAA